MRIAAVSPLMLLLLHGVRYMLAELKTNPNMKKFKVEIFIRSHATVLSRLCRGSYYKVRFKGGSDFTFL